MWEVLQSPCCANTDIYVNFGFFDSLDRRYRVLYYFSHPPYSITRLMLRIFSSYSDFLLMLRLVCRINIHFDSNHYRNGFLTSTKGTFRGNGFLESSKCPGILSFSGTPLSDQIYSLVLDVKIRRRHTGDNPEHWGHVSDSHFTDNP